MTSGYQVVDLFAGPGGLAEGFSAASIDLVCQPFKIALSVECDDAAHATLTLRTFLRQFPAGFPPEYYQFLNEGLNEPDWQSIYPNEWKQACSEALKLRLGEAESDVLLDERLEALREQCGDRIIVTGGPPCQAYSLIGRVRNAKVVGYSAEKDERYRLYKEYVRILGALKPAAFVMENVKGLLSAKLGSERVVDLILSQLRHPVDGTHYTLLAIQLDDLPPKTDLLPSDFVVRSELHGVPQARHRIIIIGLRQDIAKRVLATGQATLQLKRCERPSTVNDAIGGMPQLRSGVSKGLDTNENWFNHVITDNPGLNGRFLPPANLKRKAVTPNGVGNDCPAALSEWLRDPMLMVVPNNETRSHIANDLKRYRFAALFACQYHRSPKASDFPAALAPAHANWASGAFSDRFRVQIADAPATTITSHIAKDGHYFIHPDPSQCRSLTVREAARLQTFPDNYYFKGNRTQQYTQVGNAVPPFLAKQIGEILAKLLFKPDQDIDPEFIQELLDNTNYDERAEEYA
jgi:DNA (cytosine-5)-methyltransferase 1